MSTGEKLIFPSNGNSDFYHEVKQRIAPLLISNKKRAVALTTVKLVLFPSLFFAVYYFLLRSGQSLSLFYLFYGLLGVLTTLMVLNIVHDAMHKTLYENSKVNFIARHLLDVVGADSYAWEKRHVYFHHPYTNIPHWDVDLEKKELFRLSPVDTPQKIFRYQHIYMLFIYPLFTLHWIFVRDVKDYFNPGSMFQKKSAVRMIDYFKFILFKLFYIFYLLVLPAVLLPHSWYHYLGGFMLMHGLTSIITLAIVLPNHWDENASFPSPSVENEMGESWALHQLKSTNDFAIHDRFSNFIMGGMNHHVAHHLFPHVNSNFMPVITKELIKVVREKQLPYKCFSFRGAILSHLRLLKKNGYWGNVFEEE